MHPYDRSEQLTPQNAFFEHDLERFLLGAYHSDTVNGDMTMDTMEGYDRGVAAVLVAKGKGVFCGAPLIQYLLDRVAPNVGSTFYIEEGTLFEPGTTLVKLSGLASELLKLERTVLNALQRFCGIATQTAAYSQAAKPTAQVAATRKTLYGLLDKYAVSVGGGLTHRLHLGDAPLYKENHWVLLGESVPNLLLALESVPKTAPFVTIEIETLKGFQSFTRALPKTLSQPAVIMLDNFTPAELKSLLTGFQKPENLLIEASGGITLKNIGEFAKAGVDVISVGALTHSVQPIDCSITLEL